MYQEHTVGVVIPAYDEAGFVGDVIETIPDYVDRIYPVDDCSTDDTWAEIRAAAARVDGSLPAVSADGGTRPASEAAGSLEDDGRSPGGRSPDGRSVDARSLESDSPDADSPDGGSPEGRETAGETDAAVAELLDDLDAPPEGRAPGTGTNGSDAETEEDGRDVTEDAATRDAATERFDRRVVPIQHEENRGVGGAIKTGYQRARADRIDVTVVMGGDGQMDPDWMPDLLDPIVDGRAEYAKANRLLLPEHHETMPGHRFVGNHVLTVLTKIASGYWSVGDPQHGYTAISLHALETAGIDEMYEFFGYCNDLLIRLSAENLRVADVPCPLTYADEQSHIAYSEYVPRVSGMLLRSFLRRLWVDRGSAAGRGRLALFVGGAIATVGGLLGLATAARSTDGRAAGDDTAADGDAGDGAATGGAGACRSVAVAIAGVGALLGAMLVDAVTNSAYNYTERLPEGSGPRTREDD